jgi:hypothetical protein
MDKNQTSDKERVKIGEKNKDFLFLFFIMNRNCSNECEKEGHCLFITPPQSVREIPEVQ